MRLLQKSENHITATQRPFRAIKIGGRRHGTEISTWSPNACPDGQNVRNSGWGSVHVGDTAQTQTEPGLLILFL